MSSSSDVPVIDLAKLQDPGSRERTLQYVLHAVRELGLFYVTNTNVDPDIVEDAREQTQAFFDLPMSEKRKLDLPNAPSFLGYATLGSESTKGKTDWREHLTVAQDVDDPKSGPVYRNMLGPSQWPESNILPRFRPVMERFTQQSTELAKTIRQAIAESMGLDRNIFESLFEEDQQDRMRLIKYPEPDSSIYDDSENPSLGSHQDTTFGALIYQIGDHKCLQALSPTGEWIYCPPLPGTVVYVLGQSFNAYTYGFCHAAWHRVIPPSPGSGSRYSMVLASFVGPHTAVNSSKTKEQLDYIKRQILKSQPDHKPIVPQYLVEESKFASAGQRVFTSYVKSFPTVAQRWYPDLLAA